MLHVRILYLSTLHSKNLWSCLPSSGFAWEQTKSKLGGVDTPFCITILHLNLSLFIDIFHIMMQYLCYFILICMFGNCWRCIHRSLESDGKVHVKTPDFRRPKNSRKIQRSIFRDMSHGARRGRRREQQGAGATPYRGPT